MQISDTLEIQKVYQQTALEIPLVNIPEPIYDLDGNEVTEFWCSMHKCMLPVDMFSVGRIKRKIKSGHKSELCRYCLKKSTDKRNLRASMLSVKYNLPQRWFQYTKKGLEFGMVATMCNTGNYRTNLKIKTKDLWDLYCCHIYLHGRICAYTGKQLEYFYADNHHNGLNAYMPSLDHVLPLSTIGEHDLGNIAFCTLDFNTRKNDLPLDVYFNKLISDNGLPVSSKPNVEEILANISNTYAFYLKHRGTSKMQEIENYVLNTSPYKFLEDQINNELDLDFGF